MPRPISVLIVDDQAPIRSLLADLLAAEGFVCRTAGDGEEALRACAADPPDLILLDIVMPRLDGIATCRRLKAHPVWAAIPVIALTGLDDAAAALRMQEAGSLLYLTKPIVPELLQAAVRLALEAQQH